MRKSKMKYQSFVPKSFNCAFDHLSELMIGNGFTKDNCFSFTFHSKPNDHITIEELSKQFFDLIEPAGLEYVNWGEYLQSSNISLKWNKDERSSSHLHGVIKVFDASVLKPFMDTWNAHKIPGGSDLFYLKPCFDLDGSLVYLLKQLMLHHGFMREPYTVVIEKRETTVEPIKSKAYKCLRKALEQFHFFFTASILFKRIGDICQRIRAPS